MDTNLSGKTVAILVHNYFEQVELTSPKNSLESAGATVHIVSPEMQMQGLHHIEPGDVFKRDVEITAAHPDSYDGLVVPGGVVNADQLRVVPQAQSLIKAFHDAAKPIAVICHGPWLLVSAGLAKGRKLTSFHTLRDDIENAGGDWVDQEVVIDGHLITSRKPDDLRAFNAAFMSQLELSAAV